MASSPASSPSPSPPFPAATTTRSATAATTTTPKSPSSSAVPHTSSSSRRLPPPCWTNDETLALIDSYRDKWYSLRRGNLRAADWQDVADAVARRSRHTPGATPKTSVQCRHKIEKLRKRYRAERQRSQAIDPSAPPASPWVFFSHLHSMEVGPNSSPASAPSPSDEDEDEEEEDRRAGPTRSLHGLMENGGGGGLRFKIPKAVRSKIVGSRGEDRRTPVQNPNPSFRSKFPGGFGRVGPAAEEMRRRLEKRRKVRRGKEERDAMGEVVSALRMLGDRFMRMEQMKMEQAREMERARMDMELKRTEMVLESQRRIVDAFVKGLIGKKRAKVTPES